MDFDRGSVLESFRLITDRLLSEISSKCSEINSYQRIRWMDTIIDLIVTPGRRKLWKWSDYALVDADVAVIVVKPGDGRLQIPQVLEPAFLAVGHGVRRVVVAINSDQPQDAEVLTNTKEAVLSDLLRIFGESASSIPIVAVDPMSPRSLEALLSSIVRISASSRPFSSSFQLCISSVFQKDDGIVVEGRVRSGTLTTKLPISLVPAGLELRASSIRLGDGSESGSAEAGQLVAIKIDNINKGHVSTGMLLVSDPSIGRSTRLIKIEVSMLNNKHPIRAGFSPVVSILSCHVHANIQSIDDREELALGDMGTLTLSLQKTVYARPFTTADEEYGLGRVILRQENVVIAVGVIRAVLD
jgi:translation elongation factor EF-1alpha